MNTTMTNQQPAVAKDLRALIGGEAMQKQFKMALPKVLPVDQFIRSIMTAVGKTPALLECAHDSVMAGCMTAASLGLSVDPAIGQAYLIPFQDNRRGCKVAQFVVGYKGMVNLFYRSGQAAGIQAEPVYEKDHFIYELGLNPKLEHIPSEEEERGPIRYCYAIASLANGGKVWKVLNRGQVMKAKKYSKGSDSSYSPWQTNEGEMWAKTAIRALSDLLPLSPELQTAVATIDSHEREFANSLDISSNASIRIDPPKQEPESVMSSGQPLTPIQQLNAAILDANGVGVKPADITAALAKIRDCPTNKFTDDEAKAALESVKMAIRVVMEKQ